MVYLKLQLAESRAKLCDTFDQHVITVSLLYDHGQQVFPSVFILSKQSVSMLELEQVIETSLKALVGIVTRVPLCVLCIFFFFV